MPSEEAPYNPLDKANLSDSVVRTLRARPVIRLGEVPRFRGAGLYLIYYTGEVRPFPNYEMLGVLTRNHRFTHPIYAGKAVPAGGRRGVIDVDGMAGTALYKRLAEHAASIKAVSNLDIDDFHVRYLTVDDTWIGHAEGLLLRYYRPLWNQTVDGFGNHAPGKGRHTQRRSSWDTIHPGRPGAAKCAAGFKTVAQIEKDIADYMASLPALESEDI